MKEVSHFALNVLYSQISVFLPNLKEPFNNWTDRHVAQGFAWRPGSASFGTLDESGPIDIKVSVREHFEGLLDDSIRAVKLPFRIEGGEVEIATITESKRLEITEGEYDLVFQIGRDEQQKMWCVFEFVPQASSKAEILRADQALKVNEPLIMTAEPAR